MIRLQDGEEQGLHKLISAPRWPPYKQKVSPVRLEGASLGNLIGAVLHPRTKLMKLIIPKEQVIEAKNHKSCM